MAISVLLLLSLLVGAALTDMDEAQEKFAGILIACHKQFPISNETLSYTLANGMAVPDESNEDARCFVQCLLEKFDIVKNGEFDVNAMMKQLEGLIVAMESERKPVNQAKLRTMVQSCSTKDGVGKCMKNYLIYKCVNAEIKNNMASYAMK